MRLTNNQCPVCGGSNTIPSVKRNDLIVMQNYVYRSHEDALHSPTGSFELRACSNCGFAYNAGFDVGLLTYDENYDNLVPSTVIEDYYREIATFLYDTFSLNEGPLVEIGCGKGAFLSILCDMYPDVEAIGMDPSYQPENTEIPPNVRFIPEIFDESHIQEKPSLIVCRHVLEHMVEPKAFLESIRTALNAFTGIPFFIEVPDLEWMVENNAFWDFCYEHCNYFTSGSLKNALRISGFKPTDVQKKFEGQYLWSTGIVCGEILEYNESHCVARELTLYSENENGIVQAVRDNLNNFKKEGNKLIVWGMATKGVVFCNLIDPGNEVFDHCIDINKNKSGCFVPHTGHRIDLPETLTTINPGGRSTIIVMNPNYLREIADTCASFGLTASFVDATGNKLAVDE